MNNQIGILLAEISRARKRQGLTQAELAGRCGIKQGNISRMESGRHIPSLETLLEVAGALGLRLQLQPANSTVYHVMLCDEPVADVSLSSDKKQIRFKKWKTDGIEQPFSGDQLTLERFYRFLKSRCYEDHRADLPEILQKAHFLDNNPYDWVRLTHGVTYDDFFWIRLDQETISWDDVRIR